MLTLPDALEQRFNNGTLVFGEVGKDEPDARTYQLADGNFVVVMTSGMMDFMYAVGRAMSGLAIVWSDSGEPMNVQALDMPDIVSLTADVFKKWRKHCQPGLMELFRDAQRIEHGTFAVTEHVRKIHETLVTSSELFMLAHEIGHVMLDDGLANSSLTNEELRADQIGLSLYLPAAIKQTNRRMAFAGAAFLVRVFGSLGYAGATFSRAYPGTTERLKVLLKGLRSYCPSDQFFDEASTMMVSQLDFMDAIDRQLGQNIPVNPLAAWQTRVRLIAVLQAVAEDQMPISEFVEKFAAAAHDHGDAEVQSIGKNLRSYYDPTGKSQSQLSMSVWLPMCVALIECVDAMDSDHRKYFT